MTINVNLTSEIRLEQALKAECENPAVVTKLTICGTPEKEDFLFLRKNMNKTLQELDLNKANIKRIFSNAFLECTGLTSITIPDSVISIGSWAFRNCTCLRTFTIPNSVKEIGNGTFSYCNGLTKITIPDSVTKIDNNAFNPCISLTSVIIPDSVTTINFHAFAGCESLTEITIPDSVTKIEEGAFSRCKSLTEITIPASVTEIEESAFEKCPAFIIVHPDNPVYKSENGKIGFKAHQPLDPKILKRLKELNVDIDNMKGESLKDDLLSISFLSSLYYGPFLRASDRAKGKKKYCYSFDKEKFDSEDYKKWLEEIYEFHLFYIGSICTPNTESDENSEQLLADEEMIEVYSQYTNDPNPEFLELFYSEIDDNHYFVCLSDRMPSNPRIFHYDDYHEKIFDNSLMIFLDCYAMSEEEAIKRGEEEWKKRFMNKQKNK